MKYRPVLLDPETHHALQDFLEVVLSVSPKRVSWARDVGVFEGTYHGIIELGRFSFAVLESEAVVILTPSVSAFRCLPRARDFAIVFDAVDQPISIHPVRL